MFKKYKFQSAIAKYLFKSCLHIYKLSAKGFLMLFFEIKSVMFAFHWFTNVWLFPWSHELTIINLLLRALNLYSQILLETFSKFHKWARQNLCKIFESPSSFMWLLVITKIVSHYGIPNCFVTRKWHIHAEVEHSGACICFKRRQEILIQLFFL